MTTAQSYWNIKQVRARASEYGVEQEDVCPACGGLGVMKDPTPTDEYIMGTMIPCPHCTAEARGEWLRNNCGLSGKMLDATLSGWIGGEWPEETAEAQTKQRRIAYTLCKRAVEQPQGLYTFWGDFGSGKSHALATVVNEARHRGVESYYITMAQVLDHVRAMFAAKQDWSHYWQRLLDVPVLALDEVDRFSATDWAQERMFLLVDTRYTRRTSHLTLFATNGNPNDVLPPTSDLGYLYSRMREGHLSELRGDFRPAAHKLWWTED